MNAIQRSGPRILIIRLSAIGDVVVTTPVSRVLREHFPDAYIGWVVEPRAAGFLKGNPYIDAPIEWTRPKGTLSPKDMYKLRGLLRPHRFDIAIDFQGLLRSALVARISGAKTIIGNQNAKEHADLLYHQRVPRSQIDLSSRQRCLDLLQPLGIHSTDRRMVVNVSESEEIEARGTLAAQGLVSDPYVCLVPATTWKQKHWFEDRWGELAALISRRLQMRAVFLGGPADEPMIARIQEAERLAGGGESVSLAGKTSLKAAAATLAGAAATVSVDTALMHASVAVGTPTVGVCGASQWPGFADYPNFRLVREDMSCSPCLHNPICGGRFDCMRALSPERVLAAVESLLPARPASGLVVV